MENQKNMMIFRGTPKNDLGNLHMMALASVNFGAPWSLTNIRWTGSLIPWWACVPCYSLQIPGKIACLFYLLPHRFGCFCWMTPAIGSWESSPKMNWRNQQEPYVMTKPWFPVCLLLNPVIWRIQWESLEPTTWERTMKSPCTPVFQLKMKKMNYDSMIK